MNHIKTIKKLLAYEVLGMSQDTRTLLADAYSMAWMYVRGGENETYFPSVHMSQELKSEMKNVYEIPNREYKIYSMLEQVNVVTAEIIESYTNSQSGVQYITPIMFIWRFDDEGKVIEGKHYCDPDISYANETPEKRETMTVSLAGYL